MRALRWFRALGFPSVSGQKGRFGVEIGATMHMSPSLFGSLIYYGT